MVSSRRAVGECRSGEEGSILTGEVAVCKPLAVGVDIYASRAEAGEGEGYMRWGRAQRQGETI